MRASRARTIRPTHTHTHLNNRPQHSTAQHKTQHNNNMTALMMLLTSDGGGTSDARSSCSSTVPPVQREGLPSRAPGPRGSSAPMTAGRFQPVLLAGCIAQAIVLVVALDVKIRAYFQGTAQRLMNVRVPAEDRQTYGEDKVGRLIKSMYGTQGASHISEEAITTTHCSNQNAHRKTWEHLDSKLRLRTIFCC